MPAVHPEPLLADVQPVGADDLRHPEIRRRELCVARARDVEVPCAAEVVLGAGARDRRIFRVVVEVELDLALAPPSVGVHAPGDVGADVVPLPFNALEQDVRCLVLEGVGATPLGVEVGVIRVVAADLVRHLVVDTHVDDARVLDRQVRTGAERHRPVGVEAAVRVGGDRLRVHLGECAPSVAEEVAVGNLDGGLVGAVPVGPQEKSAPVVGVRGDPDVCDLSRTLDACEVECLARLDVDAGGDLPSCAEITRVLRARAFGRASATADRTIEVLGRDRARLKGAQTRDA